MPTTITSAGVTFTDTTTLTSANGVPSALKLTTARTINGVSFDGTGNITIPATSISGANVAKAWVNFNGAFNPSVLNFANGDILTPNNGLNTVNWFNASGPWVALLGVIYKFVTIGGSTSGTLGGVSCSQLYLQLVSSSGSNATFKLVNFDGTNTSTVFSSGSTLTGNGTSSVATFNSTAIRSSFNVSSVTKNATGDYTVNFANAMADANYSFFGCGRNNTDGTTGYPPCMSQWLSDTQTINALQIRGTNGNNSLEDFPTLCVSIFGN